MARLADGIMVPDRAAYARSVAVRIASRAGLNVGKVKQWVKYPRIVRWSIKPEGVQELPFGVRIERSGKTIGTFIGTLNKRLISAGRGSLETPEEIRVGDVIKVIHPGGAPMFRWRFNFEYEGQQFRDVSGGVSAPARGIDGLDCDFPVSNITGSGGWINFVTKQQAEFLLQQVRTMSVSAEGSASGSIPEESLSVSAGGSASVSINVNPQEAGERSCSFGSTGNNNFITDFDSAFNFEAQAQVISSVAFLGGSVEYREGGDVVGYAIPLTSTAAANVSLIDTDGPELFRSSQAILTTTTVAGPGTTLFSELVPINIYGLDLQVRLRDSIISTWAEDPPNSSTLDQWSIAGELFDPEASAGDRDNGEFVIPAPNGWPQL